MPIFIQTEDFTGLERVNENSHAEVLEEYIDECEPRVLRDLLGDAFYRELINDLDPAGNPQTQKWIDFVEGVDYTDECGDLVIYTGIKRMLVKFTFYKFTNEVGFQNTHTGVVFGNYENSVLQERQQVNIWIQKRYREAVELYDACIAFLKRHTCIEQTSTSTADLGSDIWRFFVDYTLYLEVGDTVEINGTDYPVIAVDPAPSFDIDATGLPQGFGAEECVKWCPFPYYKPVERYKPIFLNGIA